MTPKDITITITVGDRNYNLEGIPEEAFKAFTERSKKHFPNDGEDAWASVITDVILSLTTREAYFMTDIPHEYDEALERVLGRIGWDFGQFHTYLLHSAANENALRVVSFQEDDKSKIQLGTVIITGLRKSTFAKIQDKVKVPIEVMLGYLMYAFENGTIQFTPESVFTEANRP